MVGNEGSCTAWSDRFLICVLDFKLDTHNQCDRNSLITCVLFSFIQGVVNVD